MLDVEDLGPLVTGEEDSHRDSLVVSRATRNAGAEGRGAYDRCGSRSRRIASFGLAPTR
jgi:hypothetical protein